MSVGEGPNLLLFVLSIVAAQVIQIDGIAYIIACVTKTYCKLLFEVGFKESLAHTPTHPGLNITY